MSDWLLDITEGAVADKLLVPYAKIVFYRGHIDCMGLPFGMIVYDIRNPPWKNLHGVPNSVYSIQKPWGEIMKKVVR